MHQVTSDATKLWLDFYFFVEIYVFLTYDFNRFILLLCLILKDLDFIIIAFGLIGRTGEVCSFLISSKAFLCLKKERKN